MADEIGEITKGLKWHVDYALMMPEWNGSMIDGWNVKARFYPNPPRLSQVCHPPRRERERESRFSDSRHV